MLLSWQDLIRIFVAVGCYLLLVATDSYWFAVTCGSCHRSKPLLCSVVASRSSREQLLTTLKLESPIKECGLHW